MKRSRSIVAVLSMGLVIALTGCGLNPFGEEDALEFAVPDGSQLSFDFPSSLGFEDPLARSFACPDFTQPGPAAACATREALGLVTNEVSAKTVEMLNRVSDEAAASSIPQNVTVKFKHDDMDVSVWWRSTDASADYRIDATDEVTGAAVARWHWSQSSDGGINGEFVVTGDLLHELQLAPDGVSLIFTVNGNGTEKDMRLTVDGGLEAVAGREAAPTRALIQAVKDDGMWTIGYGMFHPAWLNNEEITGQPTVVLGVALAEATDQGRTVMRAVAVPATDTGLAEDADSVHSLCVGAVASLEGAGLVPPGVMTCVEGNPFYLLANGGIQEAGTPPSGFAPLQSGANALDYLTSNPSAIMNLTVSLTP